MKEQELPRDQATSEMRKKRKGTVLEPARGDISEQLSIGQMEAEDECVGHEVRKTISLGKDVSADIVSMLGRLAGSLPSSLAFIQAMEQEQFSNATLLKLCAGNVPATANLTDPAFQAVPSNAGDVPVTADLIDPASSGGEYISVFGRICEFLRFNQQLHCRRSTQERQRALASGVR